MRVRDLRDVFSRGDAELPAVTMSSETSQLYRHDADRSPQPAHAHHPLRYPRRRHRHHRGRHAARTTEPEARARVHEHPAVGLRAARCHVGPGMGRNPIRTAADKAVARRNRQPIAARPAAHRSSTSVPREIAPLVVTLNRLFEMLRTSVQSQQQFIANTAHQLRTPITGMQAQLGSSDRGTGGRSRSRHASRPCRRAISQLAHSANQLLTLARADQRGEHRRQGAAGGLARDRERGGRQILRPRAAVRHRFRRRRSGRRPSVADPSLLDDLLSNLVDNALKYTPAGGTVTVSAGHGNGRVFLSVEDSGPGIPEGERQRVRQRFYRMPNSPGHGSGLGLAIVDEIAALYDGSVTIGAGPNGLGTRVSIHFPQTDA